MFPIDSLEVDSVDSLDEKDEVLPTDSLEVEELVVYPPEDSEVLSE
jgi:hypothetical protein